MSSLIKFLFLEHPQAELRWDWYWLQFLCLVLPLNAFISAALAIGLIIFFVARHGIICLDSPINRGWLLFALLLGLSVITAYDVANGAIGLVNFYPFLLLFAIATYLLKTSNQSLHLGWLLVLNSLPLSLFGITQVLINRPDWMLPRLFNSYEIRLGLGYENRISSLFGHTNEFALYCLMLMPIVLHFSLAKANVRGRWQIVAGTILASLVAMLIVAQSRNVWGLAFVGLLMQSIFYSYWWLAGLLGLAVPGVVLLAASAGVGRTGWQDFVTANEVRVGIWQFCMDLIVQKPLLGWGLRNFNLLLEKQNVTLPNIVHEHNFFLAIALGSGMPALALFVVLVGRLIISSWRSGQAHGVISVIAVFAVILFLLSGIYDTSHYELRVFSLFWLMAAIAQAESDKILLC